MQRLAHIVVGMLTASVLALLPSVSASAETSHTHWFDLSTDRNPMVFIDSHVVVTHGTRVDGICRFTDRFGPQTVGADGRRARDRT